MTLARPKVAHTAWQMLPLWLRRKLRTRAGTQFARFVPVALAAVITSQITLAVLNGPAHVSAGTSAIIASMVAAAVSYVLSRWAWGRKGRPDLLRETLPFWAVSIAVWLFLGLITHLASVWAHSMDLHHWRRVLVVNGAYFLANCVTFVIRFAIFHYVLFADRTAKAQSSPAAPGAAGGSPGSPADGGHEALSLAPASAPARGPGGRHEAGRSDRPR
jgi:putative flippase GtrA